jgi:hypothetical protein
MSLFRIKNPVEYSFFQWMNSSPDSGHWADKERFLSFVKTVCRYKASKWKNRSYLKKKILENKPHFDKEFLENLLDLHLNLLEFHKSTACSSQFQIGSKEVKKDHFIEIRVEKGKIVEQELPLKSHPGLADLVDKIR